MSYQIRHKRDGVYQGSFLGLGFWHPMSEMPEQGFCEFPTKKEAEDYITFLTTEADYLMDPEDLSIEPYDRARSEAMQALSKRTENLGLMQ
jgi:hypothetical protein